MVSVVLLLSCITMIITKNYLTQNIHKSFNLIIFLIFLFSLIIRLFYFFLNFENLTNFTGDERDYFSYLSSLIENTTYTINLSGYSYYTTRDPLFPFFLYLLSFLNSEIIFYKLILVLISSLNILILASALKNFQIQNLFIFISCFVISIYPPSIFYSIFLVTETLSSLIFSLIFLFFSKYLLNPDKKYVIILGILFGLLALNRSFFLYLPFFLIFFFLIYKFLFKSKIVGFFDSIFIILFFILTISPWVLRNTFLHDEITLINSRLGYGLYSCNYDLDSKYIKNGMYDGTNRIDHSYRLIFSEKEIDKIYLNLALVEIKNNYIKFFTNNILFNRVKNFLHFKPSVYNNNFSFTDLLMFLIWMPIFILFLLSSTKIKKKYNYLCWSIFIYTLIMILPFWGTPRFRYPIDNFIIIIAIINFHNLIKLPNYEK